MINDKCLLILILLATFYDRLNFVMLSNYQHVGPKYRILYHNFQHDQLTI